MNEIIHNIPNAFVLPRGAQLPEGASIKAMTVTNLRDVCTALSNHTDAVPIALIFENMDLLSMAIKYQDLVPWVPSSLIGVAGGEYDVMFDQVTFPIDKVSFDILDGQLKGRRERPIDRRARDIAESIDEASILKRADSSKQQFGPSAEDEESDTL